MAAIVSPVRRATMGEFAGMVLAGGAVLPLVLIAALTEDPGYAFHVTLALAAAVGSLILIANRVFQPGQVPAPQEIDGRPNYSMDPVKFATIAATVWGIAGFS